VNQRQSVQALNDEVDALGSQLEEIRLQPASQEPQDNVAGDTESMNSSLGASHLLDLNATIQQAEDDEMEEVNEQIRSPL
jgi:hypothetical protein